MNSLSERSGEYLASISDSAVSLHDEREESVVIDRRDGCILASFERGDGVSGVQWNSLGQSRVAQRGALGGASDGDVQVQLQVAFEQEEISVTMEVRNRIVHELARLRIDGRRRGGGRC